MLNRTYRFLDGDAERRDLVHDIQHARRAVLHVADHVPAERHYEPRYNGWTLGGTLAHLHLTDNLCLMAIQMALVLPRVPVPLPFGSVMDSLTASAFQKRVVPSTVRGIRANEQRIADLILRLPMSRFTKLVYDPVNGDTLTIEQALQTCFLHHWQEHSSMMQKVEGMYYEPPERFDSV